MNVNGSPTGAPPPIDGGKDKGNVDKPTTSLMGSLLDKISSLNPFKTESAPTEIEMTDFASSKGKEEVSSEKVHIPEKSIAPSQQDARITEKGVEHLAQKAPETVKDATLKANVDSEAVIKAGKQPIGKERADELRKKLLPEGGAKFSRTQVLTGPSLRAAQEPMPKTEGLERAPTKVRSHEDPGVRVGTSSIGTKSEREIKRDALLAGGVDLRTKQGEGAEVHAMKTNACLTSSIAHAKTPVLDNGAQKEFANIMKTFEDVLEKADLNNPAHCKMLNNFAGLMQKGFIVDSGGVGSFSDRGGWNSDWGKLGDKDKGGDLRPGNPKNEDIKKDFKAMLAFFKDKAPAHFSDARHVGSRELASGQTACTVGQLINDFTHDADAYPKDIRETLFNSMQANGLIHETVKFDSLDQFKLTMRSNPLLAEVKNAVIQNEIAEGLSTEKNKEAIVSLIKGELGKLNSDGKLSQKDIDELANKVYERLPAKVKDLHTQAEKTGARGRIPFAWNAPKWMKAIGGVVAGAAPAKNSIAVSPDPAHDRISDAHVKTTLEGSTEITKFYEAVNGKENMMKVGGAPKNPLRLGQGLDSTFMAVMDPKDLLRGAIEDVLKDEMKSASEAVVSDPLRSEEQIKTEMNSPSNARIKILQGLSEQTKESGFEKGFQGIVGKIEVTFNGATRQKMALQDFSKMKSVAAMMYDNDLRTICSISGTTVDVILAKITTMGDAEVKKLLQPLLDHIDGKQPDPLGTPGTPEGKKFKQLASAIGMFMQTGKYHTAGEVIGGLFIAARGLSTTKEENINIKETFEKFGKLMKEFSDSPETFLDVDKEDLAKVKASTPEFTGQIRTTDEARIRQRQADAEELAKAKA